MKINLENIKNRITIFHKSNHLLTKLDLEGFMNLMDSGFTFQQCLMLLETKENQEVIKHIQTKLLNGQKLNEFFYQYIPKKYGEILQGFIGYTTLEKSLHLTIHLLNSYEKRLNKIKQKLLYPFLLVLFTSFGLCFFDLICIPELKDLVSSFDTNLNQFNSVQFFIHLFILFLLFSIAALFILVIYIQKEEHLKNLYLFLDAQFPQSLFVKFYSQEFMRYFIECTRNGLSTRNTIQIMKSIPKKPIIYMLSCEIEQALLEGTAFINAIKDTHLDQDLMRFMQIAIYSKEKENILEKYLSYSDIYIEKRISKITTLLQSCAYIIIGFFMIVVYQILMVPLSLFATF